MKEGPFDDSDHNSLGDDSTTTTGPSLKQISEELSVNNKMEKESTGKESEAQKFGDEGSASHGTTINMIPGVLETVMLMTYTSNLQWLS